MIRIAALLGLLTATMAAAEGEDGRECATVSNDAERLACYDLKFSTPDVPDKVDAPSQDVGNWIVLNKKSAFDDTTTVNIRKKSDKPLPCGFTQTTATLFIRCLENRTSLFISTGCHLASGFQGYGKVDLRVDDQKSFTLSMDASTDNSALGLWSGRRSIPQIKKLIGGKTLRVRFTPFNNSPVEASFDITGIGGALTSLRAECGW